MRINPDTKDALLFMTGLLGMVAQGVLAAFGIAPSVPLIGAYLAMCGIASASSILGGRIEGDRPPDDPPSPRSRRKSRDRKSDGA